MLSERSVTSVLDEPSNRPPVIGPGRRHIFQRARRGASFGLGTGFQEWPSQRSINVRDPIPTSWRPTAHADLDDSATTPARPSSAGPGSPTVAGDHAFPSQRTMAGARVPIAPTAQASPWNPATSSISSNPVYPWIAPGVQTAPSLDLRTLPPSTRCTRYPRRRRSPRRPPRSTEQPSLPTSSAPRTIDNPTDPDSHPVCMRPSAAPLR